MDREEAIAIIRKEYLCVDRDCDIERSCGKCDLMMPSKEPILEAYKMAIKALEQEPCRYWQNGKCNGNTEVCEDAISRQDVLDLAKKGVLISNGNYESVCKAINEIPSAEPKTGHWIIDKDDRRKWDRCRFYCSECGKWQTYGKTKYCLHCGARMIEPQERSDKA